MEQQPFPHFWGGGGNQTQPLSMTPNSTCSTWFIVFSSNFQKLPEKFYFLDGIWIWIQLRFWKKFPQVLFLELLKCVEWLNGFQIIQRKNSNNTQ